MNILEIILGQNYFLNKMNNSKQKDSIKDFGDQFTKHSSVDGYWGSKEMLQDIVNPFDLSEIKNKVVCEVGVGSGRIVKNLSKFDPKLIYGIEPSEAINVAKNNNKNSEVEILFKQVSGQEIDFNNEIDYIFSLGVIHHIPEAEIVCKKIYQSLKKNGKFIIWVYGKEGNKLYLLIFNNLRKITRFLPYKILNFLSNILNVFLSFYIFLCKFIKLPLKDYMLNVLKKCSYSKRKYIIFDQLNPTYSKYYSKDDLKSLLTTSGFKKFKVFSRYNYSWTAIAEK